METSNLKNMVVLKNLPSNIIDEAIIVLKSNKKIKKLEKIEKIEKNKNIKDKEEKIDNKEYILKEAEMLVNSYISEIENKKQKDIFNKNIKQKYKKVKKYSIILTGICILQTAIIIFT